MTLKSSTFIQDNFPPTVEKKELKIPIALQENLEGIPGVTRLSIPNKSIYIGVETDTDNQLHKFETLVGKDMSVYNTYVYWDSPKSARYFDDYAAAKLLVENKVIIISWNPCKPPRGGNKYTASQLKKILRGQYDNYIYQWVLDMKKWDKPVMIRFAPEMNGNWLPWGSKYSSPAEYKKAYRYVVNIFRKNGVKNVSWVWSPNESGEISLGEYYPGDNYVDWVGLSGFNWGGLESFNKWRSFDEVYSKSFNELRSINKPVALIEFGSVESKSDPRAKARWIRDSLKILPKKYPKIKMLIWSNSSSFNIYDWKVDTSTYSLNSFKKSIDNNHYLSEIQVEKL